MDLVTKNLLISFLFILLSLFLLQMIYMVKYAYKLEDEFRGWTFAIFPVVSLVLCMLFPASIDNGLAWDLRWIPFILGGLYGGYRLGTILLFLVLFIRYFQGVDMGFYVTVIVFSVSFLSSYYLQLTIKQKLAVGVSLNFLALMISLLSDRIFGLDSSIAHWKQYIVIHIIGMLVSTLLCEVIRTNFQVLQRLVKAEKQQIVSHLAASISHEVRNPLTVSRGFIQLLSGDLSPQSRKEYANIALQELDRATEVINDYLTFAKPALENEDEINVNEELRHVINVINPLANMNGVHVRLSLSEHDHYFIKGGRKQFQQCLINILKNGIESMPNNGELHISQHFKDSKITIDIQDEGTGMTREQIDRLGEPYFTTKEKGTGLGMMVSYSIIKGMNGTIHVTSEYGKGTRFSIKLPAYHA